MNTTVMIALGAYRFSLPTAAYQQFQRRTDFPWTGQERLGRAPARQKVRDGDDTITLSGVIYPHYAGGLGQIDAMRAEAGKNQPLMMVDGRGRVFGRWVILSLHESAAEFFADGAPKQQRFRLEMSAYGEDAA